MKKIILAVDPGTRITGFAVISSDGRDHTVIDCGVVRPPVHLASAKRYLVIYEAIEHLIEKYVPEALSVETQFVYKNVQSALKLGMARAAVMLAAAKKGVSVHEYAPRKAKQAVVGNGNASKLQVQRMVQQMLKLPRLPEPPDVADALALALCHAHQMSRLHV